MAEQGDVQDEILCCCICYNTFKEPKTLSCMHRYCEQCLHNYIIGIKSVDLVRKGGFQCPVCRDFIKSPNPKRPPSDWASLFRTDFYLKNLIRYVESELSSRRDAVPLERPCQTHADKERDLYCNDCAVVICHLCAGIFHRTCSSVLTLAEVAEDRRAATDLQLGDIEKRYKAASALQPKREKMMEQLESSRSSAEEAIRKWGKEVHQLIQHEEQKLLQQLNIEYASVYTQASEKILKFDTDVAKLKETLLQHQSQVKSLSNFDIVTKSDLLKSSVQISREINLDNYTHFLTQLSEVKIVFTKKELPSLTLGDIHIQRNKDRAHTSSSSSKTQSRIALTGKRERAESIKPVKIAGAIALAAPISNLSKQTLKPFPVTPHVKYKPPPPMKQGQSSSNARNIDEGSVSLYNTKYASSRIIPDRPDPSQGSTSVKASGEGQVVTHLRSINTRLRADEEEPKLRDLIVISPGNTILVTDWANQSVKALYVRRERNTSLKVGSRPWGISQLTESLVAVSLPLTNQICIIKIDPSLMVQNSFVAAKNYSGLAALNNSMLVASGGSDPPSVDIIDRNGEVLKSFASDSNGSPLFIYPAYVSVTPASLILVSDKKQGCVICLSHTGKLQYKFPADGSRQLREPNGIVTTSSGHVLVVETRGLLSLTPDGHHDQTLIKPQDEYLNDPRGIAMDKDGLLYVSTRDFEIRVFRV